VRPEVAAFHELYYTDPGTWPDTFWMGVATQKCPLDLWIYQELLHEVRPTLIIETGTCKGGSALYLASICDILEVGRVVTIDIEHQADRPTHPRITYLTGSSTAPEIAEQVRVAAVDQQVMVILDSDHSRDHVIGELRLYADLVAVGSYLIVEDTNINGHPVLPDWGPGPMEALDDFLAETDEFEIDESREKFHMTFNPRGYLRRVR
jgi:cephalosporin hydroxylase